MPVSADTSIAGTATSNAPDAITSARMRPTGSPIVRTSPESSPSAQHALNHLPFAIRTPAATNRARHAANCETCRDVRRTAPSANVAGGGCGIVFTSLPNASASKFSVTIITPREATIVTPPAHPRAANGRYTAISSSSANSTDAASAIATAAAGGARNNTAAT